MLIWLCPYILYQGRKQLYYTTQNYQHCASTMVYIIQLKRSVVNQYLSGSVSLSESVALKCVSSESVAQMYVSSESVAQMYVSRSQ